MNDYEKYQLEWMIDHGYSLEIFISKLAEIIIKEELIISQNDHVALDEAFEILEETGFNESEIWACQEEWEQNDKESTIFKERLMVICSNAITYMLEHGADREFINLYLGLTNAESLLLFDEEDEAEWNAK